MDGIFGRDRGAGDALDDLAAEFLAGTLPRARWTHDAHLSVGAWHVFRFGVDEAIVRLRVSIRALNVRQGTANTATSGYHETITVAYARLVGDFLAVFDPASDLALRVSELLASPLADRSFLDRFWSRPLLMSEQARATWVAPDLRPLALPPEAGPCRTR